MCRTRCTPSPTTLKILIPHPNPFLHHIASLTAVLVHAEAILSQSIDEISLAKKRTSVRRDIRSLDDYVNVQLGITERRGFKVSEEAFR